MKITFILPGGGRSGGVRCTVAVANRLVARGHQVRLVHKRPALRHAVLSGWRGLFCTGARNWLVGFDGPKSSFKEGSQIEFEENEIVVGVGMWSSSQLGRLSAGNNPRLQYIHGLTPWMPAVEKETLCLPFAKVAVASYITEAVKSYNPSCFCQTIPNGIDLTEYYPCLDDGRRDGLGTIYSPGWAKDPETVLGVLAELREQRPAVPQRVFGVKRRPKELGATVYTRQPSIAEARQLYSQSKVWIMASRSEGFSVPILEAMACGCAVVATDCGGPRDIICDGENGFLAEVGNVPQIVDKVVRLLTDESLRRRFVLRSRETVQRFSWERSVDELEKVLLTISSGRAC